MAAALVLPAAAPLPPERPAALSRAAPGARLRSAPLPPPMPFELRAARATEAGAPEEAPAEDTPGIAAPLPQRPPQATERVATAAPDLESAPLPPRPPRPRTASRPPAVSAPPTDAPAPGDAPTCPAVLASSILVAEAVSELTVKPGCPSVEVVRLKAVMLDDGTRIAMKPAALVNCATAEAVAGWVRGDLAPDLSTTGRRLTAIRVAGAYECRPRNRQAGARLSEHALGNALDVGGFEFASGAPLVVVGGGLGPFSATMRESACRRFTTVLGPGSDGFHEDHIHVDLARRNRGFRLCRWLLKDERQMESLNRTPAAAGR